MNWLSRTFGKKQEEQLPPFDLSGIQVDMHSHLIPGIDDGSRSMDESIALLAKFESLGYKKVITTPHIIGDYYRNTPETILGGLEKVRETAEKLKLKIEIEAAAEYYFDDSLTNRLKKKEKLLTFGDNYVLFEFPMHEAPHNEESLIFELVAQGYKPVLAHYERYTWLEGDVERAQKWREMGVNIQVNMNSLLGHYGPQVASLSSKLVQEQHIDFLGSDCHRIQHLMLLEEGLTQKVLHEAGALSLKNQQL